MARPPIEGRALYLRGRKPICAFLVGTVALMGVATLMIPGPRPFILLPMLGFLALTLVPVVVHALTSVVVIRDGVLTQRSAFGSKQVRLAEVREARVRTVHTKSGPSEQIELKSSGTMRISERREAYPALREAILAGLPPGVRPHA